MIQKVQQSAQYHAPSKEIAAGRTLHVDVLDCIRQPLCLATLLSSMYFCQCSHHKCIHLANVYGVPGMCHLDPSVNNTVKTSVLREGPGEERPAISGRYNKK